MFSNLENDECQNGFNHQISNREIESVISRRENKRERERGGRQVRIKVVVA